MTTFTKILIQIQQAAKQMHALRWTLLPPLTALLSIYLLLQSDKAALLLTAVLAIAGATSVLKIQPKRLIRFYFLYLMFEGAFKLLTNYNPLVHVGSDVILVVIFLRLVPRFSHETNPDLTPAVRERIDRVSTFLLLFWLWVAIQFFNPWGLGLFPSIAGLKIHFTPMLMLFIVGYLLTNEELRSLPPLLMAMGLFQGIVALIDWHLGPQMLPMLHPRYQSTLVQFLQGFPYRPFGTTNLPGAPGLWMFHTLTAAMIMYHLASSGDPSVKWPKLTTRLFMLFVPIALATLAVCQVRAGVIRFLAMTIGGTLVLGRRYTGIAVLALIALPLAVAFSPELKIEEMVASQDKSPAFRLQQVFSRLGTLSESKSWDRARGGAFAIEDLAERANFSLVGNGLSRFGAAAAPWKALMNRDHLFKAKWSFSDNVLLALFTELGIGGVTAYLLLMAAVLWHLLQVGTKVAWLTAGACAVIVLSGMGSEGILFQPDASFFWFYAAFGLRSIPAEVAT